MFVGICLRLSKAALVLGVLSLCFACSSGIYKNRGVTRDGASVSAYTKEFKVSEVLPEYIQQKLTGEHFEINSTVKNIGGINRFEITSQYGALGVDTNYLLQKRIEEFSIVAELAEIHRGEAFVDSQVDAVGASADTVVAAVSDPVKTAEALPGGVVRLFTGAYDDTKGAVDGAVKFVSGETDASSEIGESLGTARSVRALAQSYKVDPYTRNKILQEELSRLALFMAHGKKAEQYTKRLLGGDTDTNDESLMGLVWKLNLVKLEAHNKDALSGIGLKEESFSSLFENTNYIPSEVTRMVDALDTLKGAENTSLLVEVVGQAKTVDEAIFYLRSLEMLAFLHEKKSAVKKISVVNLVPAALLSDNTFVIVAPVDYMVLYDEDWRLVDQFIEEAKGSSSQKLELWVEGIAAVDVVQKLSAKNVTVVDQVSKKLNG